MTNKIITIIIALIAITGLFLPVAADKLGGKIHNIQESFDAGIAVDGTERISGTGGASFTTITSSGDVSLQDTVQGGGILTETSGTTTTWQAANICDYSIIKWSPKEATNTTTIDTAANIIADCLTEDGDYKDIVYWNIGGAASTTVFTMGTGVTAYIYEATGADKVIEGLNLAHIRFTRASSTAVYMSIDEQLVQ